MLLVNTNLLELIGNNIRLKLIPDNQTDCFPICFTQLNLLSCLFDKSFYKKLAHAINSN